MFVLCAQPAHATKGCGSVKDVVPTGVEDIPAVKIRATRVPCRFARKMPAKVVLNARYGYMNPNYSKRALGIAGWRCDLGNFGEQTACHKGPHRVSWYLGHD
jgi:hypothetical protein